MRWSLLVLACLLSACAEEKQQQAPAPTPPKVTIATPIRQDIVPYFQVTGRTRATEIVEIRARVTGFLEEMKYDVGTRGVKKGDILFVIEKTNYIAARDQAKADLEAAKATKERADSDFERFSKAAKTKAVSEVQVTMAKAQKLKAAAQVIAAEAALKQAELDLSYCDVRSPIDGQPNRNQVDVGNLVGPNDQALLTTVVRRKPIHVYFEVPEKYVNEALEARAKREKDPDAPPTKVQVALPGGDYRHEGIIDWAENMVDPSTGTLRARAVFDNKDGLLYSGVYVRVRIIGESIPNQILVREKAIGTDMGGKYLMVLDEKNVVERRYVELGQREGTMRVIRRGLEGNERYITIGVLRARPGLPVTPVEEKGES
ncbi:MAG: efflux RND transporter periplasmic adaptor subunit [Planctomycetota bacterium]|jgi:multidrug efflux system membrane fusion protein